jgi:hypothetical protein
MSTEPGSEHRVGAYLCSAPPAGCPAPIEPAPESRDAYEGYEECWLRYCDPEVGKCRIHPEFVLAWTAPVPILLLLALAALAVRELRLTADLSRRSPQVGWISDCHFSAQLNHFMPGFLSYPVPVFLK